MPAYAGTSAPAMSGGRGVVDRSACGEHRATWREHVAARSHRALARGARAEAKRARERGQTERSEVRGAVR